MNNYAVFPLCSNHSWVSFEGFSQSYNDAFKLTKHEGMDISM